MDYCCQCVVKQTGKDVQQLYCIVSLFVESYYFKWQQLRKWPWQLLREYILWGEKKRRQRKLKCRKKIPHFSNLTFNTLCGLAYWSILSILQLPTHIRMDSDVWILFSVCDLFICCCNADTFAYPEYFHVYLCQKWSSLNPYSFCKLECGPFFGNAHYIISATAGGKFLSIPPPPPPFGSELCFSILRGVGWLIFFFRLRPPFPLHTYLARLAWSCWSSSLACTRMAHIDIQVMVVGRKSFCTDKLNKILL